MIPACSYQDMGGRDGRGTRSSSASYSPAYAAMSTMRNLVSNKVEDEDGLLGRTHANLHIHAHIILTQKNSLKHVRNI